MLCMCGKKIPNNMLQMNVTVTECYDEKVGAKISCAPLGEEPITYEWYNSNKNNVELNFDSTKSEATNVPPGDYYIKATDRNGLTNNIKVTVNKTKIPVVVGYEIENASTQVSRDGKITAHIVPQIEGIRYLWTTGAITDDSVLEDVRCGMYTVCLMSRNNEPIPFIHASQPAIVNSG